MSDGIENQDLPEPVEECALSIKEDNPDMDKPQAIAICQDMHNDGELSDVEDYSELDYSEPVEKSFYQLADIDTEPIEREELGENKVVYRNLKILSPGVWTDSNSRETIWYSPRGLEGMEVAEDNAVNIMHDSDNEVSEAGEIIPDSMEATQDGLFADLEIDTSTAAGQYADENLQKALETHGAKGFGGPSVEIDAEGQDIEFNEKKGMQEMLGGVISGLGLVKNPASKPVSIARQTANRGVALSDGQGNMFIEKDSNSMDEETKAKILSEVATRELQLDEVRDDAQNIADELDVPVDEVMEVLDPLLDEAEEEEGEGPEEDVENEDDEDEEDEDEEQEMATDEKIQSLEERLTNLEDMVEQAMAAEDMQEELEEAKEELQEELADAETVSELADAKDELDKRLSELEEEPENPKTLSDADEDDEDDGPLRFIDEGHGIKGGFAH